MSHMEESSWSWGMPIPWKRCWRFNVLSRIVFPATGLGPPRPVQAGIHRSMCDDLVAIVELPGVNKEDLNIQAKENTIRIAGRKWIDFSGCVPVAQCVFLDNPALSDEA